MNASMRTQTSPSTHFTTISRHFLNNLLISQAIRKETIILTERKFGACRFFLFIFSPRPFLSYLYTHNLRGTLIYLPTNKQSRGKKKRPGKRQPKQLVYFTIIIINSILFFGHIRFEIVLKIFFFLCCYYYYFMIVCYAWYFWVYFVIRIFYHDSGSFAFHTYIHTQ